MRRNTLTINVSDDYKEGFTSVRSFCYNNSHRWWSSKENRNLCKSMRLIINNTNKSNTMENNLEKAAKLFLSADSTNREFALIGYSEEEVKEAATNLIINQIKANMIRVVGGTFTMGDGSSSDNPEHRVSLSSYWIARYNVTEEEYNAFLGFEKEAYFGSRLPITSINWYDSIKFCEWLKEKTGLNFNLPTEAQWEYAAKGGMYSKGYIYSGSNDASEVAVFNASEIAPVGTKKPNELGIYDMSGNVWEWCLDGYTEDFYIKGGASDPGNAVVAQRGIGWRNSAPEEDRLIFRDHLGYHPTNKAIEDDFTSIRLITEYRRHSTRMEPLVEWTSEEDSIVIRSGACAAGDISSLKRRSDCYWDQGQYMGVRIMEMDGYLNPSDPFNEPAIRGGYYNSRLKEDTSYRNGAVNASRSMLDTGFRVIAIDPVNYDYIDNVVCNRSYDFECDKVDSNDDRSRLRKQTYTDESSFRIAIMDPINDSSYNKVGRGNNDVDGRAYGDPVLSADNLSFRIFSS
jgi:formylglycine-generating enzyme required for sulfatase activity